MDRGGAKRRRVVGRRVASRHCVQDDSAAEPEWIRNFHALLRNAANPMGQAASSLQHGLLSQNALHKLRISAGWCPPGWHDDGNAVYTANSLEMALAGMVFKAIKQGVSSAAEIVIVELDVCPGIVYETDICHPWLHCRRVSARLLGCQCSASVLQYVYARARRVPAKRRQAGSRVHAASQC
jgi:hypothetical protein